MGRKAKNVNPLVKKTFQENDVQNIAEAQSLMLEAEMDETLGYSKHERNDATDN